ncbi:radical SAM protein [Desulfobulbus rhabdoformis]|uniref:NifB/NifX family molybdenum-iron cluster-binding protein n=1 Tax=Desulfobulbus rhabdoformis TaxID=34032 RepID=UPI0019641D79|nr:NifB/NifX family molybdenum-iron cluster-binding protein [Desulfobulbus rhabdoformis]MBM9614782.1 radical SAM protein [Desulfobulbus rhabdoformis]
MTVIPISNAPGYIEPNSEESGTVLRLPVAPIAFSRMRYAAEGNNGQALNASEVLSEIAQHEGLSQVVLDGPGDPLASMAATMATISMIHQESPELKISVTTLGFGGADEAAALAEAGVQAVTLLVDTLDGDTAEKLYGWIRPGKKTIPLKQVVPQLLEEQSKAVQAFADAGIQVTIRSTVYPGYNAHQLAQLAESMAALGASAMELVPFEPAPEQEEGPEAPTRVHMEEIAKLTNGFLPTVSRQVAVDSCGCASGCGCGSKEMVEVGLPKPTKAKSRVAVASASGMDVDLHLGQTETFLIYGPREDGLNCLLETRKAPPAGSGESRWDELAETLNDCFALLAASAGQRPREVLGGHGLRVILTEENIEGTVDVLYGGGKKKKCK